MTDDPFRSQVLRCPACEDVLLEPMGSRLVCPRCGGMQISAAGLAEAIEQLVGAPCALDFDADAPGTRACPRCNRNMTACRLRVTLPSHTRQLTATPPLDRCDACGVWFDPGELESVFAAAGHTASGDRFFLGIRIRPR